MQERANAIRAILARLAANGAQANSPELADLQARCHHLVDEARVLRQRASTAEQEVQTTRADLSEVTEALRRAERKVDRLQSRSVLLSERPSTKAEEAAEKAKLEAAEAEQKAAIQRKEAAEASTDGTAPSASSSNGQDAASKEELEQANALALSRLEEGEQLRSELIRLRQECERLQLALDHIPDDHTRQTPLYRDLHGHFTHAQQELERLKGTHDAVVSENADLRERRYEFQASAQEEASAIADKLREQLKARDADVTRLRTARDEATAELSESRAQQGVKLSQCEEMKQLVTNKDLRIHALRSEVRRLQMSLAAQRGDKKLLDSLKASTPGSEGSSEEDVEIIAKLSARLKAAEEQAAELQRQADARASSSSEAELLAKVSSLQSEVEQLKGILGQSSNAEEVQAQLVEQKKRVEQMEAELMAANESTNALCEEIEKLSQAYADMDKQASSKVMDLTRMEEKVLRLTTEKAKADNRYFATMRTNATGETDRAMKQNTIQRQATVIEHYKEAEVAFNQHVASHEREVTSMRKMIAAHTSRIAEMERDIKTSRMREGESQSHRAHAEERMSKVLAECEEERAKRQRLEEQWKKMERDLEKAKRQAAQAIKGGSGNGASSKKSSGAGDSEIDFLQALLQCSSCKDRYRDRIITKCGHTFCSACIEARISTRQRKCPHCGLSFAVSDVQPLFFQ